MFWYFLTRQQTGTFWYFLDAPTHPLLDTHMFTSFAIFHVCVHPSLFSSSFVLISLYRRNNCMLPAKTKQKERKKEGKKEGVYEWILISFMSWILRNRVIHIPCFHVHVSIHVLGHPFMFIHVVSVCWCC